MKPLKTDVVIVGSGVSGALLASKLSAQGIKVLILEAGGAPDRSKFLDQFYSSPIKIPESPYPESPHAPFPKTLGDTYFTQLGPVPFKSTFLRLVGGTTWHWLGTCMRLLPDDFNTFSKFGVGVDWPVQYKDIEPWYAAAEKELGVAGFNSEDLGSPRSGNYPLPEIPYSSVDTFVKEKLKNQHVICHTPQARNSVTFDDRPPCCRSSSCVPICPIQAKYDATVHLKKAQAHGAQLFDNSVVFNVVCKPDKSDIDYIEFKKPDGTIIQVTANLFVLAANAIENVKILLMSKSKQFPTGIANRSDQLGRNLMDHPITLAYALTPTDVFPYKAPLSTAGIEEFRNGDFRKSFSPYRLEIHNDGWTFPTGGVNPLIRNLIDQGLSGKELRTTYRNTVAKQITFAAMAEQLPLAHNRVQLDHDKKDAIGLPHPKITYDLDSYQLKGFANSKETMKNILGKLNCTDIKVSEGFFGAGHILGTHRMGSDSGSSVVNEHLQCHDHKNLFLLGGGVMPTCGTSNPTLTIAALALKCSDYIVRNHLAI